jgi:tetratricopeptide (TPR) repeat protein
MLQQRYQAAFEVYSKIAQPSAAVWNKMGIASQMLFNPKNAARCYKQALKLDPNEYGALNNLATIEDTLQNFSAAERLYRRALKVEPGSARVFKNLGTNLLMQHKYSESSEAYAKALALNPRIFDSYSGPTIEARVPVKLRGDESYLWARTCAHAGLNECAITQLRRAFDEGSATTRQVENDKDFEGVRQTHDYQRLLAEQQ